MVPRHMFSFVLVTLLMSTSARAQEWPTYVDETALRMPTGPGVNDPAYTTADPDDKNYAWGDVDQDGDPDLVCVRKQAYLVGRRRNVLFLNEGVAEGHAIDGVLVDRTAEYASSASDGGQGFLDLTDDRDVVLVDVDGDGWLDMVTTTTYGQGLPKTISHPRVYINQRSQDGEWQGFVYEEPRTPTLPMAPNFCGIGFGDVTGDGAVDLYHIDYENNLEDRLWINDGNGFFADESEARMTFEMRESEFGTHAEIADMNGDGVMDVVKDRANGTPYRISISYNDPDNEGFFGAFETVYTGAPYYVEIADLNNDDLPDIVLQDDGIDRYYLNQGNGADGLANFTGIAFPPASNGISGTMEVADLNNDGFMDVMITDESVNTVGTPCARHMITWRNLGDVPNISFQEETGGIPLSARIGTSDVAPMDLNGDGWLDLVIGTCSGTSVWISQPVLGANYAYPDGIPTLVAPDGSTEVLVQIQPVGDTLDPASPQLHLAVNSGLFTSVPLTHLEGDLYSASLGTHACLDRVSFYFSAQLSGGATFNDPADAPGATYDAIVADDVALLLEDNVEGDVSGWTIASDETLTTGQWEQADPNGTIQGGDLAAPEDDATEGPGNVMAFVTENGLPGGAAGANDVDGGATTLTSPSIDLEGLDARISYARWFFATFATPDSLVVEISSNGGASWELVEEVATTNSTWEQVSFVVGDIVPPTADVQVRFTASDFDASIVEAGIDDFRVETFVCIETCPGDVDGSGSVDAADLAVMLGSWGPNSGHPADLDGNDVINAADLAQLLGNWGPCA